MIKKLEGITKEKLEEAVRTSHSYSQAKKKLGLSTGAQAHKALRELVEKYDISLQHFWRERKDYLKLEELKKAVASSTAMSEVFEKMGFNKYGGGNYRQFKTWVKKYELDISHFTGQAHRKGKQLSARNKYAIKEILIKDSPYQGSSSSLKKRLIKEGILENKCYECGLIEWRGKKLVNQLEHMNGDSSDHRIENLTMLCPNCHSQTSTYCRGQAKNKCGCDVTAAMTDLESVVRKGVGVQVSPSAPSLEA